MSDKKYLPIEAIAWFAEKLEQTIEDTAERVAQFFNATLDIEEWRDEAKALADLIIDIHKKQVESLDLQLVHWYTLKLTKQQKAALSHCQEHMCDLYRLQELFEQGPPGTSGHGLQ